jgi:opacity protein-like surface antigen
MYKLYFGDFIVVGVANVMMELDGKRKRTTLTNERESWWNFGNQILVGLKFDNNRL